MSSPVVQILSNPLTSTVLHLYQDRMKAARRLAENVVELLGRERFSQHDLAQWCRKSDPWVSQFLRGERNWQLDDLDRVADMFGLQTYQLFIPGISARSERRVGLERRSRKDRRVGQARQFMMNTAKEIDGKHPRRRSPDVLAASEHDAAIKRLSADFERKIAALLQAAADTGQQTPTPRAKIATPRKSD